MATRRSTLISSLVGVVLAVGTFGEAGALEPGDVLATANEVALPADSLSIDAQNYADYWHVPIIEARARLSRQQVIEDLAAQLEAAAPSWFGGLWIEHDPYAVVVGHTGDLAAAQTATRDSELLPFIEYRRRTMSLAELQERAAAIREILPHSSNDVDVDLPAGGIVIRTTDARDANATSLSYADVNLVRIEEVTRLGESAVDIYGGLAGNGCTFGFTVFQNADPSPSGIMTAGHCSNSQTWSGVALPFVRGSADSPPCCDRDAQWHTTPNIVDRNWVIDNANGHTRVITFRRQYANVVVGETLCKYGTTTKYTCGEVISKTDSPPWIQNPVAVWLKVGRNGVKMSEPGDSGGPLFMSSNAYGIVQGHYFEFAGTEDGVFGSPTFQERFLQVTIKTS